MARKAFLRKKRAVVSVEALGVVWEAWMGDELE